MGTRYQQPQGAARLDRGNPITRDAYLWLPTSPLVLFGKRMLSAVGETGYNAATGSPVGDRGVARKWSRSANAGIDFGVAQAITQNAGVTVIVVAAPTAGATMKVPFSQRIGGGSYTQTDFVFNAATIDSLGATAGNVALTTYHAGSGGVLAAGQIDGKTHCWVAGNGPSNGYIFRDGVKQTLSSSMRMSTFASGSQKLRIGNMADDATTTYPCDDPLYLVIVVDGLLPEDRAASASANPWQFIEGSQDVSLLKLLAAGGTLNASAAGSDTASGSADIAAQVALAGIGVSSVSGTAVASASIPLSAAGLSLAGGGASATASITLGAAALAEAAGQAGISASVLLAGAGAALAAGNAELAARLQALAAGGGQAGGSANLTGGAPGTLSATGGNEAGGQAVLTVTVGLQATGTGQASGTANGQANAPGQIQAIGGAMAGGSAIASAVVALTAAGFVQAMGQGEWTTTVPLAAFGGGLSSGSGVLSLVPDGAIHAVTEWLPVRERVSMLRVPERRLYLRV